MPASRPRIDRRGRVIRLYTRSPAARKVAALATVLSSEVREDRRRVVPVAWFARLCGISERLAWQWVSAGLVSKNRSGKAGLLRGSVVRFLRVLHAAREDFQGWQFPSHAGRPRSAIKEVPCWFSSQAKALHGMTPRQAAEHLGVSRGTILRAIHEGTLEAYRPTPRRTFIGRKPRKKVSASSKKSLDTGRHGKIRESIANRPRNVRRAIA